MKLHIPTMLLTALLAVQATYTAKADTIYSGHYYDNGKEMCSDMPKPHHDDEYCWANVASNMVQYWQDTYLDKANEPGNTPNGTGSAKPGVAPYGTSYLDVYTNFLKSTYNTEASDKGAFEKDLLEWYFKGTPITDITDPDKKGDAPGAYYSGIFGQADSYKVQGPNATDTSGAQMMKRTNFDNFIKSTIDSAGGIVGLDVNRKNPDGQQNKEHAITCVGYEIGADGKISSIIVTDSDDKYFGAFKLQVKEDAYGFVALLTDNKVLKQDAGDEIYFLGRDYTEAKNYVYNLTAISTPGGEKEAAEAAPKIDGTKEVTVNTRLTEDQELNGNVTVGDGENVVVLTTGSGKKLTIAGSTVGEPTALDIKRGALVSVDSLVVMDSPVGGVHAVGNLHVGGSAASGDTATFTGNDNTKGNGGAILNESFVDISGNDTVVFADNNAYGKGGAIYSKGTDSDPKTYDNTTVSIRGNGTVTFSGNMSGQGGNDIYVEKGAFLNIADNDSVTFTPAVAHEGEAAIVNKGTTYLAAAMDLEDKTLEQKIEFMNCSLDSREGTVVIGGDINNQGAKSGFYYDGYADFKDNDDHQLSIANYGPAAEMQNVWIDATGITGEGVAKSLISHIYTGLWDEGHESTGYTLRNLTLDATGMRDEVGQLHEGSSLDASDAITLNNVNITMNEALFDVQDDIAFFDLKKTLVASTNFEGAITFDASSFKPQELPEEMRVRLSKEVTDAMVEQGKLTLLMGNYEYEYKGFENNDLVFLKANPIVPEPATGTLSLLALAGLCARRRRK